MELYQWEFETQTTKEMTDLILFLGGKTRQSMLDEAKAQAYNAIVAGLTEKAQEQGLNIDIVMPIEIRGGYHVRQVLQQPSPTGPLEYVDYYKLWINADVRFYCEQPLMGSPVAPAMLLVFKWVLTAFTVYLVAALVAPLVIDWLKSMTTTTHIIRRINPDGTIYEEENINPNLPGMGLVGLFGVIALVVILLWLFGSPKRGGPKN